MACVSMMKSPGLKRRRIVRSCSTGEGQKRLFVDRVQIAELDASTEWGKSFGLDRSEACSSSSRTIMAMRFSRRSEIAAISSSIVTLRDTAWTKKISCRTKMTARSAATGDGQRRHEIGSRAVEHGQGKEKRTAEQACGHLIDPVAGKPLEKPRRDIAGGQRKHNQDQRIDKAQRGDRGGGDGRQQASCGIGRHFGGDAKPRDHRRLERVIDP
jgi:hypothetical protein